MNNKKFEESGYCFSFLTAKNAVKADEKNYAQLSSVDFIVETDSSFLFIEVPMKSKTLILPNQKRKLKCSF